ncbi:MAG: lipocalin-like domain-containing protein [Nitrospirales bacterium]
MVRVGSGHWKRSLWVSLMILLLGPFDHCVAQSPQPSAIPLVHARPGYSYVFPRDHGSHDQFRIEWWYFTGHLFAKNGRRFGFELTFFRRAVDDPRVASNRSQWAIRQLYFAHFALTDEENQAFRYAEKLSRAGLGKAGAEPNQLEVWIDRWRVKARNPDHTQFQLEAATKDFAIDLLVETEKPPAVHGEQGVSRKGAGEGQASHYYSFTRLSTKGTIWINGNPMEVTGLSWMDHEFGSGEMGEDQVGWDWFSIQLDSKVELMIYLLRQRDGTPDPASSGTLVFADGETRYLPLQDITVHVLDHWVSPHSGARYPSGWNVKVHSLNISLNIVPRQVDQELVTTRSTQVTYWEGAVDVRGHFKSGTVMGVGYVELTGYAKPIRMTN